MYTIWNGAWEPSRIVVQPLAAGKADPNQPRRIIASGGGFARFVPGATAGAGDVIYTDGDSLLSIALDLSRLAPNGPPRTLAGGLMTNFSGGAQLAVSPVGVIAYVASGGEPQERELDWVTRDGTTAPAARLRGLGRWYDLAPDGRRVVRYKTAGNARDVWVDDLTTGTSTQITRRAEPESFGPIDRLNAVWSEDGRHIVFAAGQPLNLYVAPADGSGGERRLTTNINTQWPGSWSPDGRTLAFVENNPQSGSDIWLLSLEAGLAPGALRPFLSTPFNESAPMISPDGRWLAYQSNESGRYEIYVQPFPDGGQRLQVSPDNGVYPRWSPRGNELFFRSSATRAGVSAAAFDGRGGFAAPRQLFELRRFESILEVAPDAQRFLMMPAEARGAAPSFIQVITPGAQGR
jgi:dipeptidyl aminopeptidase/acylaminoacyl peptidase